MNFEIKTDNSKRKYTWSVRAKVAVISEEFETQDITGKSTRLSSFPGKEILLIWSNGFNDFTYKL